MIQQDVDRAATARTWDYVSIAGIMTAMGGFFWAIRGTGGYGGETGGMLAGLGWAVLWQLFSRLDGAAGRRPYGSGWVMAAITLGIAVGGLTGYGVYVGWVQGKFYLDYPHGMRAVTPWTGYAMLFLCGLHWGGLTGAFMAWCAPNQPVTSRMWLGRIAAGIAGALAAVVVVRLAPQLFLPFHGEGLYADAANKTCTRAADSVVNIAPHVGAYLGFLFYEAFRRDRRAVALMLVMGLGFAIPFTIGGYWHTFNESPLPLPWWKNWEMSIGLGGGLAFGLAFYLFNRPEDRPLRRPTRLEWTLGAAGSMWLACQSVFGGAYEGFRDLHVFAWPASVRVAFTVVQLAVLTALLAWWVIETRKAARPIPAPVLMAALAVIWIAGYATSIPRAIRIENVYLLTLYTLYLAISLALWSTLRGRLARSDAQ